MSRVAELDIAMAAWLRPGTETYIKLHKLIEAALAEEFERGRESVAADELEAERCLYDATSKIGSSK